MQTGQLKVGSLGGGGGDVTEGCKTTWLALSLGNSKKLEQVLERMLAILIKTERIRHDYHFLPDKQNNASQTR